MFHVLYFTLNLLCLEHFDIRRQIQAFKLRMKRRLLRIEKPFSFVKNKKVFLENERNNNVFYIEGPIVNASLIGRIETSANTETLAVVVDTGSTGILFPKLSPFTYSPLNEAELRNYFVLYPDDKKAFENCSVGLELFSCVKHKYGSVYLMGALSKTAVCSAMWPKKPFCFLPFITAIVEETDDSPYPESDFDLSVGILGVGFGVDSFLDVEFLKRVHEAQKRFGHNAPKSFSLKCRGNAFRAAIGAEAEKGYVWIEFSPKITALPFVEFFSFSVAGKAVTPLAPFKVDAGRQMNYNMAVFDTGTNVFVVPVQLFLAFVETFNPPLKKAGCLTLLKNDAFQFCCEQDPELAIEIDLGKVVLKNSVWALMPFDMMGRKCGAIYGYENFVISIFGMPFFQAFDSYFDGDNNRLGLKPSSECGTLCGVYSKRSN